MNEAYVVGSGPNGLTAAITLARAGYAVTVLEAQPTIGGAARSAPLTLPGFIHDFGSAVHPMALSSPAFASMPLREHGLEWILPEIPVAHPLEGRQAAFVERSVEQTAARLGRDREAYTRLVAPLVRRWRDLFAEVFAPAHIPRHPLLMARFGMFAPWSATRVAKTQFTTLEARALFAGMAAHSALSMETPGSAAFGWILLLSAHAVGWPIPRGGAQSISDALAGYLRSLGGNILTNETVRSLNDLPSDALILCDITPRQLLQIAGHRLSDSYRRKLEAFRYGPGAFKLDWALRAPIPWRDEHCRQALTIHLGNTLEDIALSEGAAWEGAVSQRPYVLLAQPSLFDSRRAPPGQHTAWAYCHVPNGSTEDMTQQIEAQVERSAPGFRETILARNVMSPAKLESMDANLVGGDVNGGAVDLAQLFLRPTASMYGTPLPNVYLCSSSTPPGGAVHGMCGYYAARRALENIGRTQSRKVHVSRTG